LDDTAPLTTHFRRSGAFDSRLESDFAAEFETKFGDRRGQWQLTREDEVLVLGDTVMIPDFGLTHKQDGRRALVEIVGYWHPEYLRRKVAKVRAAQRHDLILLVYEGVNLAKEKLQEVPGEVLYFQNKPVLKELMAAVERVAV
jgi:predicted nuclease of restriction endonuclease-like RecB superfamily